MLVGEAEASEIVRKEYARSRPDWKVIDIPLVARKFGGFLVVVACENTATADGTDRFADEICFVSPKGKIIYFADVPSFANFLIWYEGRPKIEKLLTRSSLVRCLLVVLLIGAGFGLATALAGGSVVVGVFSGIIALGAGLALVFQPDA